MGEDGLGMENLNTEFRNQKRKWFQMNGDEKIKKFHFKIARSLFKFIFVSLYLSFCLIPIKKNQILFASDSRSDLSGNFLFIFEEIKRQKLTLDCKFMLKGGARKNPWTYIKLAYLLATSKKIIVDDYYAYVYPLKIRKEAELIQVWHAVGAFKRFGHSRAGLPGAPASNSRTHRNYTKAVVSSNSVISYYAEGFGIEEQNVKSIGIPRTDVFFDDSYKKSKKEELYNKYPFTKGKKVIMFAPTFRGKGKTTAYFPFEQIDFKSIYEDLNEEYIFILKLHPFVKEQLNIPKEYKDFYYDFSAYREINDLLLITDVLITDYSSVCFEYALLNKPMVFFAFDVDEYTRNRDFYYSYQDFIPGPIVKTTHELISSIHQKVFNQEKVNKFVDLFYDQKDGKSSKRFVDHLLKEK